MRQLSIRIMRAWTLGFAAFAAVALAPQSASSREASGEPGEVLFDGDFAKGLAAWPSRINAERISIVDDPVLGSARKVAKFRVFDGDTGPTPNPRAQLEGPANLVRGGEYWMGWSTYFPRNFPALPRGGWLAFESIYGAPARDSGPMTATVSGSEIRYQRNASYRYDLPWRMPVLRGRWVDFAWRVKLSSSARVGFVEIHVNSGGGWRQQVLAGRSRLYMRTLDSSNGARPNSFRLNNYRRRGMFRALSIYHASPKIGTTFRAVAPSSYGR